MTNLADLQKLRSVGQLREALEQARQLCERRPSSLHFRALGTLELDADSPVHARLAFSRATDLNAHDGAAHNDLGSCHARLGELGQAESAYQKALECGFDPAQCFANLGTLALRRNDFDAAAQWFVRSLEQRREPIVALGLVRAWSGLGRSVDAWELLYAVLESGQATFAALDALLELSLSTPEDRTSLLERALRDNPQHAGLRALWLRALAESEPTKGDEAYAVEMDLVSLTELSESASSKLPVWIDELVGHRSLHRAPDTHATVGGHHSGDLFAEPTADLESLRQAIGALAGDYHRWLQGHARGNTVATARPTASKIHAWAVLLEGAHYQESHFHPDAWISGCLYLDVPECVTPSSPAGHLAFGQPGRELARTVCPRRGRVVLFPSHLDHRTLPHEGSGQRLSIAFDLVAYE